MKALSIRQPWAWLISQGFKDIENRNWQTNFRGKFLIHAGKSFDDTGYRWIASHVGIAMPIAERFDRGGIVGVVELVDCVTQSESSWFFGPYGFVLRNAHPLTFTALSGRLGFFDVDVNVLQVALP